MWQFDPEQSGENEFSESRNKIFKFSNFQIFKLI